MGVFSATRGLVAETLSIQAIMLERDGLKNKLCLAYDELRRFKARLEAALFERDETQARTRAMGRVLLQGKAHKVRALEDGRMRGTIEWPSLAAYLDWETERRAWMAMAELDAHASAHADDLSG